MFTVDRVTGCASHLPVLKALGRHLPIRRVVEYGAGLASTPAFLDQSIFPCLESLLSYEDMRLWVNKLLSELPPTDRWRIVKVTEGSYGAEAPFPAGYDLAFIDTAFADSRVVLVTRLLGGAPIVVLHDYDGTVAYKQAASSWPHRLVYTKAKPQTAILSAAPLPVAVHEVLG